MSNILSAISQQKRNFGFDIIRCIAILVVVLSHGQAFVLTGVTWLPSFWIIDGVDVFFVLSGFLIGSILIKQVNAPDFNLHSVIYFWKRRWYRTIPNYLLILIISLVFVYLGWCSAGWSYYKYFIFIQNIFQPNPDFFPTSWSLSVEEWAYLLLPASLLFFHMVFKKSPKKYIILITILLFILLPFLYRLKKSFYFSSHPSPHYIYDALFRKTVATRLDAIAIGVLGAYFNFYYEKYWVKYAYVFMILGIVLFYFNSNFLSVGLYRYSIYFSVYALSILFFFPVFSRIKRGPRFIMVPVTFISLISYSMYLIHYQLLLEPINKLGIDLNNSRNAFLVFGIYLFLLIAISAFLYQYVEKPFMQMREGIKLKAK